MAQWAGDERINHNENAGKKFKNKKKRKVSIEPWKENNPGTRSKEELCQRSEDEWAAGIPEPSYIDSSIAWRTQDPPKNKSCWRWAQCAK